MPTATGAAAPARAAARWFRGPAQRTAGRAWREAVTARGGTFEARLRACDDGGCVVTFPALPQLMARGVTCQHARIKALALVERYLRTLQAERLPATPRPAADRQPVLPLAA